MSGSAGTGVIIWLRCSQAALMTAGFALYGRIVASAPLAMSDQSEADVEDAKADVRKSKVAVDADQGN